MSRYNWQMPDWPNFQYNLDALYERLLLISEKSGLISGKLVHLEKKLQTEALINLLVEEAIKTSEIEGEYISRPDVRSSIKKAALQDVFARNENIQNTPDLSSYPALAIGNPIEMVF